MLCKSLFEIESCLESSVLSSCPSFILNELLKFGSSIVCVRVVWVSASHNLCVAALSAASARSLEAKIMIRLLTCFLTPILEEEIEECTLLLLLFSFDLTDENREERGRSSRVRRQRDFPGGFCQCVCVRVREKETDRRLSGEASSVCVCCVCLCERENRNLFRWILLSLSLSLCPIFDHPIDWQQLAFR